jgi:electron transport complex protein RnfC
LKTFPKGGVHPPENKIAAGEAIQVLPLPKTVVIPISQHIGAPSTPIVQKNDVVKVGQVIAQSSGFVSTNIHSSVSGKVSKVDLFPDASGYRRMAIAIDVEGDEWLDEIDQSDVIVRDIKLEQKQIVDTILQKGIVGLGGATFPSHVKLSIPIGKTASALIINGVECEPYLTSDHRVMLEKAEELMVGIQILMKALNVKVGFIGIEKNKPDAIVRLTQLTADYEGVKVIPLKVKYPQGGEKQLIKAVTGREVPSGGLPIDVGAVVHNVGTALAVYEAVQKNKPLFERVVTVTGKSVPKPGNYLVRIGTAISDLVEAAGGLPDDTGKIINGGPMMGKAISNLEVPVTKGTSGITIIKSDESTRKQVMNCIRCGKCTHVCPMGLEPYLLMTVSELSRWEDVENSNVMDCIECGSCSYTCPSNRPLLDFIRLGKSNVSQIIRSRNTK